MLIMENRGVHKSVASRAVRDLAARRLQSLRLANARLTEHELERVATAVARDRALWGDLVGAKPPASRQRIVLHRAENYEVLLLLWSPAEPSDWHDHGGASGGYAVVEGELRERFRAADGVSVETRHLRAGSHGSFGPAHLHDVEAPSERVAVSIQAYSPPLDTMTYYERTQLGFVARTVVAEG
jgi:Cysteine dioxygenase type I